MPNPIRLERLSALILRRAAEVIDQDLADPRARMITLTKVKLAKDLTTCLISYSVLGTEKDQTLAGHLLNHARGFIQREVARILRTRVVPRLRFEFDPSIERSIQVSNVIDTALNEDRQAQLERGDLDPEDLEPDPDPNAGDAEHEPLDVGENDEDDDSRLETMPPADDDEQPE